MCVRVSVRERVCVCVSERVCVCECVNQNQNRLYCYQNPRVLCSTQKIVQQTMI